MILSENVFNVLMMVTLYNTPEDMAEDTPLIRKAMSDDYQIYVMISSRKQFQTSCWCEGTDHFPDKVKLLI
jgi:hypothetical protein